ncbi:hypothetical protein EPI10_006614 [Gossypium australe]|uniref:Uncharacterized protein n=1 Tax=Gossypium australe TaxID=47621 RepID=A0A5B6WT42_9ROSI|nr:hypothetical protein EPI10_006614 [Gossypium australe]
MGVYNHGFCNRVTIISEQMKCNLGDSLSAKKDCTAYLYRLSLIGIPNLLRDSGNSYINL